jgi:hypothetical protein
MVVGMSVKPELPRRLKEGERWNPYKRKNAGMAHLLSIVYNKEPITTSELLKELGSVEYGQKLIRRAEHEKLITRVEGKQLQPGQFRPMYNMLTDKGRALISSQLR